MSEKKHIPGTPRAEPWMPVDYEPADMGAIKALAVGKASDEQQIRAFNWIVNMACGTYDMSYRPGSSRDTDFAEGRRFVGNQIIKLTKLNLEKPRTA